MSMRYFFYMLLYIVLWIFFPKAAILVSVFFVTAFMVNFFLEWGRY